MKNLQNFQFLFCLLIFITFSYCGHSQNNLQEQIEILYQQVDTAKGNDKAITCYKLGKRFSQISEYKLALDYHLKALRITSNEKLNDLELTVLLGISAIYGRMGNYEKTIEVGQYVLNKAILLKDTSVIVAAYNNIGTAYLNLKQFEIAKKNINTALIVLPTNSSIRYRSGILNNLGLIHLDQNRTDSALIYFHKALLLADSVKDVSMIVSKKLNLGEAYIKLGDYKKAKTYLTEGLEVADKESLLSLQLDLNLRLHELYIAKDNIKMAYFHLNQSHILKDSLNQKIQDEDIKNAEIRIAVRNKENQNQLLTKGNKIKSLKIEKQKLYIYSLFAGVIIFFGLFTVIWLQLKKQRKTNQALVDRHLELLKTEDKIIQSKKILKDQINKKYSNSSLTSDKKQDLIETLDRAMKIDKLYLNPEINLKLCAIHIQSNSAYLSQSINDVYQKNFSTYLNEFRIKEAQRMLTDSKFEHLTIEGIAFEVGFKSKPSFNKSFKNYSGITPSKFNKLGN